MRRYRKQLVRGLLLALLLGPLSAHSTYVCPMMGGVVLEDCCCDDHETVHVTVDSERDPCCEKTVELRLDGEFDRIGSIIKKVDVRSDVDPPAAILAATDFDAEPYGIVAIASRHQGDLFYFSGSQAYLTTQRLRL